MPYDHADIEDLFEKDEYLNLYNSAFKELANIKVKDLDTDTEGIIKQINKKIKKPRFNHYRPANNLAQRGASPSDFNEATLDRFAAMFTVANSLF